MSPVPLLSLVFLTGSLCFAQDAAEPPLASGPSPTTALGEVNCYAPSGPEAGREFDAAARIGQAPGALLFIHDLSRNTAPVIRELDRLGSEHAVLGFRWSTILLSDDRTEGENRLERVNTSLRLSEPIVLSLDGLDGPGDYALNRKCTLTLVFADDGKVRRSVALTDTGPADFEKLKAWVQEVTGVVPQDENALRELVTKRLPDDAEALRVLAANQAMELRRLRREVEELRREPAQRRPGMRGNRESAGADGETEGAETSAGRERDPAATREGKPPEDAELQGLLRAFIRQTNDDAATDEIFKQIEARAAESEALAKQAVDMFKLMLSFRDRYGTDHAQGLAESFLESHAGESEE